MNIQFQICPRCNRSYTEQPVLSRKDSGIKICPECSSAEDLEAFIIYDRTGKKRGLFAGEARKPREGPGDGSL